MSVRIVHFVAVRGPAVLQIVVSDATVRRTTPVAHHAVALEEKARVEWLAEVTRTVRNLWNNVLARCGPDLSRRSRKEHVPERAGYSGKMQKVERLEVRCDLSRAANQYACSAAICSIETANLEEHIHRHCKQ